jgi:hypothetical protein
MKFKKGQTYKAAIIGMHIYKIHILAIVEEMVVYRWYGRHKQWWHYGIEEPNMLEFYIKKVKGKNNENKS